MRYNRRRRQDTAENASSSQLLSLSLFIMLLAFFIVLNALSSFKEVKVHPVINSIEQAFSRQIHERDIKPSVTEDPMKSINEGDTVDRIEALFKNQISNYKPTKDKNRGTMHISMPLEEFFQAVMAVKQGDLTVATNSVLSKNVFLPTLISIIKSDRQGLTYRMDVLINIPENPAKIQNDNPERLKRKIDRAGILVQRLEQTGLPQKLVSIGIKEGDEEMVDLYFHRHEKFSPVEEQGE